MRLQANRAVIKVTNNSSPEVVDWDEDGLLDLLVGSDESSDGVRLYLNSGTTTRHQFTNYTKLEAEGQAIAYLREQIQVGDINYDGKKDVLLGNGLVKQSRIYYFENVGTNAAPVLAEGVALKYKDGRFIYPDNLGYDIYYCLGDWNADGGVDILWTDYYGDAGMKLCLGDVPVEINKSGKISTSDIIKNFSIKNGLFKATVDLGGSQYVTFDIVTADGRKIDTRDMGNLPDGKHTVTIDLNRYPSGVYFITLVADNICLEQKRLLFVK